MYMVTHIVMRRPEALLRVGEVVEESGEVDVGGVGGEFLAAGG